MADSNKFSLVFWGRVSQQTVLEIWLSSLLKTFRSCTCLTFGSQLSKTMLFQAKRKLSGLGQNSLSTEKGLGRISLECFFSVKVVGQHAGTTYCLWMEPFFRS
jgi:hypothetical protein